MKNAINKITLIISIIVIISCTFLPKISFGYESTYKITMDEATIDYDTYMEDSEAGGASVGGSTDKKPYKIEEGTTNSVIKILVKTGNTIPTIVRILLSIMTMDSSTSDNVFSVQRVIFNDIKILDINFFSISNDEPDLIKNLKEQISRFYYLLRNIAIISILAVLIYTGVRMALSSIAMEKARYKKMLVNWVVGFAILMLLPYIMVGILQINNIVMRLCESILTSLCGEDIIKLEENILNKATTSTEKGFSLIIPTIIYWVLTFYQLKFFLMYGKRLFNTSFLVIISPLVLVQYVFDKAGDDQGQSFKVWMTEFALNVFIQPIHALVYIIFMAMASNIIEVAPIISIIFLFALSRGERVIRNILRIKKSNTVQGMENTLKAKELTKIGK